MAEIVSFGRVDAPKRSDDGTPEAEVIGLLEALLEDARRGNLQAIAVAGVKVGGLVLTVWEQGCGPNRHPLMAAIAYLQHRFAGSSVGSDREAW